MLLSLQKSPKNRLSPLVTSKIVPWIYKKSIKKPLISLHNHSLITQKRPQNSCSFDDIGIFRLAFIVKGASSEEIDRCHRDFPPKSIGTADAKCCGGKAVWAHLFTPYAAHNIFYRKTQRIFPLLQSVFPYSLRLGKALQRQQGVLLCQLRKAEVRLCMAVFPPAGGRFLRCRIETCIRRKYHSLRDQPFIPMELRRLVWLPLRFHPPNTTRLSSEISRTLLTNLLSTAVCR